MNRTCPALDGGSLLHLYSTSKSELVPNYTWVDPRLTSLSLSISKMFSWFMSPKINSLGTNKGHASTSKYCTKSDHETEISMCYSSFKGTVKENFIV